MGRFASTVAYYESARPPYGAAFFAAVALELRLDGRRRLLDVGAGPGILAIGFAPYCRDVVGVDPEPGMVEAARAAAKRAGAAVRFIEGRFEEVAAKLGAFDLVSIGRAVHWLDPEPARAALERALAPRGRVLVCGATSAKDGRNRWLEAFNAVRDRWKGDRPSRDHHTFFADGRFARAGTIRVEETYAVPVERLVDRVLSMSTSSSERLGDEVPAMKSAMREALAPFGAEGMIDDIVEARAEVFERAGGN
jgi:SAM-dependent methyltransferase